MASESSALARLDALASDILADWNIYTTLIAGALISLTVYSFVTSKDPDIHPFLLARQSTAFPVRQPGESAAYRSLETPHGYPLRSGLNIKDPGAPRWTGGRRGDLRDIWKAAVRGEVSENGVVSGKQGKIYTVLGKKAVEHSLDQVTQEINVIGRRLQEFGVKSVAVCLTDSVELLAAIFGSGPSLLIPTTYRADLMIPSWCLLWLQDYHYPSQPRTSSPLRPPRKVAGRCFNCGGRCPGLVPGG